jgi:hypothetical protein
MGQMSDLQHFYPRSLSYPHGDISAACDCSSPDNEMYTVAFLPLVSTGSIIMDMLESDLIPFQVGFHFEVSRSNSPLAA